MRTSLKRAGVGLFAFVASCGPLGDLGRPLTLDRLEPSDVTIGASPPRIELIGSAFARNTLALVNGRVEPVTFVDGGRLQLQLRAEHLRFGSPLQIAVRTQGPSSATTTALPLTFRFPVPVLDRADPQTLGRLSPSEEVVLSGSGFTPLTEALLDEEPLPIEVLSGSAARVQIKQLLLTDPQTFEVRVRNPGPGGGSSAAIRLPVVNPAPRLSALDVDSVPTGLALSTPLRGSGFVPESRVVAGSLPIIYRFHSPDYIGLGSDFRDLLPVGEHPIWVENPPPGGGVSDTVLLRVSRFSPLIHQLSPTYLELGEPSTTTFKVVGHHFDASTLGLWDGSPRPSVWVPGDTSYSHPTEVHVTVSPADQALAGTRRLEILHGGSGKRSETRYVPVVSTTSVTTASQTLQLATADLIADTATGVLYAAVSATPHEVRAIDPQTGQTRWSLPVPEQPADLALSDDGGFLYVSIPARSEVLRIDTAREELDITVPLPAGYRATDIEVMPLDRRSIIVGLTRTGTEFDGLWVYDDTNRRPNGFEGPTGPDRFETDEEGVVWGVDTRASGTAIYRMRTSTAGIALDLERPVRPGPTPSDLSYSEAGLYLSNGLLISTETLDTTVYGVEGVPLADGQRGRVHFIDATSVQTYAYRNRLWHPGEYLGMVAAGAGTTHAARWGTDGLALGNGTELILLRASIVGP